VTQHWKDLVEGYNFVVESSSNGIHMEKLIAHKITKPCVLWGPKYGFGATWCVLLRATSPRKKKISSRTNFLKEKSVKWQPQLNCLGNHV
jgi:hypothetical protein